MHTDLINYLHQHLSRIREQSWTVVNSQCPSTRTRSGAHVLGTHMQEGHIPRGPHSMAYFFFYMEVLDLLWVGNFSLLHTHVFVLSRSSHGLGDP